MAAVVIQPTEDVTEYTATIKRETLKEGKKGRHVIDSLRLTLKAEGDDSTEATASLKYNRNKNILTTDIVIPNYDVELGIKVAGVDSDAKQNNMRGITIEVTNKNIPQLTVMGCTRLELMKNAMLQLQMVIPALKTNMLFTATLKKHVDIIMNMETLIKLPETSYQQSASLIYDKETFEVQLKSDLNSEIQKNLPNVEDHRKNLEKLIENMLDRKVAKTDMKVRHIVTKGIEAVNIWLGKLTVSIPILKLMQNKRRLSNLIVPSLPERMFLQFDNLFRYKFNKDYMAFSLPLPLGGKKSEELHFPSSLSVPALDLSAIGLHVPPKIYRLPSFIVPPALDFTVPLLGVAEASIKINSNFYSLEGSISGGNHSIDSPMYIVQYKAITNSPFNLLIYNLEGTGMMSGRGDDHLEYLMNNSFSHSLIQTRVSISETLDVTHKLHAKANYKIEASSPLGLHTSFHYDAQSTSTIYSDEVTGDGTWDGTLQIGSFYTNSSYSNSYKLHPQERKGRGELIFRFNSPFLQIHNTIHGVYANFELNIVSKTNAQKDIFNHVAELDYKGSQLTIKSSGVAKTGRTVLRKKVEFGVSNHKVIIKAELEADDDTNRAYHLITCLLNARRIEVHSKGSLTFDIGQGLHNVSIVFDNNGLTTSGTNSIQYILLTFENIFSGSLDSNKGSVSSMTKAMAKEGYGELKIEGKMTAKEGSFYGVFHGNVFNAHTRNNVNVVLNRSAFTFISTNMATMGQVKTEHSHTLTLTLWTLALRSSGNVLYEDIYYKQDTKVDMKPFVMTFDATNELKCFDLSLNKKAYIKFKPFKVELSGYTNGAYGEGHIIKHTYEINYEAIAGKIKSNTSGNLLDVHLSQTCELEFAGLSSTSFCESHINSKPLHFDSIIHTQALPFSFSIGGLFNGDGEIHLYGKHTGQLYSKLLVKAEPLVFAYSYDSTVSTVHALSNWELSTQLDNKLDAFLMQSDQAVKWKMNSKIHNHSFDQNISASNDPQKAGFEFSQVILTDAFHRLNKNIGSIVEMQEFNITGFLKYDKSSNCRIIPILFPVPAAFDQLKNTCIYALETLTQYTNSLNINQMISDFRVKLDQLPSQVSDFMKEMDLEDKVNQIKEKLDFFMNGFDVTMDDLEVIMNSLKKGLESKVLEIAAKIQNLILLINDYVKTRHLTDKLTHLLTVTENKLHAFNEKYIKGLLLKALHAIVNMIDIAWLHEVDSKHEILKKIQRILADINDQIESFDVRLLFQQMNKFLLSTDMGIEKLLYDIPYTDIANMMESVNDVVVSWIDEYEIPEKLNAIYSYIKNHISKYDLSDKFKEIIDQTAIFIEKIKIEETVHSIAIALNALKFEFVHDQILQMFYNVKTHLKLIDIKKIIQELGDVSALESLKHFDYNSCVNKANKIIAELTNYINEMIQTYEVVSKVEAFREFTRKFQSTIFSYVEKLQNTKVAESLKTLKHVIDNTFYVDIKMKVQDVIEDIRQRVLNMDIRDEVYFYLQRASESYNNIIAFISLKIKQLIEEISKLMNDSQILCQIKQTIDGGLNELNKLKIQVHSFTVLFTDLVIPAFTISMSKLQEITIPEAEISVPEFNIMSSITVPAFTISFDELKAKILAMIDYIKQFEIPAIDPDRIFRDIKVLYIFALPDVTFPEITLSEIKVPNVTIPILHIKHIEVTSLPMQGIKISDIPNENCVQVLGQFQGEFKVNSHVYTLAITGKIENSTSIPENPKFTATINSNDKSTARFWNIHLMLWLS
ncbi:apolipoprotein B-100-like isoform X1 [Vanacampus margaritifer]